VLEFATSRGAEALGLSQRTGALVPGLEADLVLIDTRSLRLSPVNDPIATVVLYASPGDVAAVMVAGRWVKVGGKLLSVDAERVRRELVSARDRLLSRSGLA
jgi:cytosine/adenosine deaminase-related metal-dependent hydrolase